MIFCKGFKKNGKTNSCDFVYAGNWGDSILLEHEGLHKKQEDGNSYFWLGFEIRERFEKRSGRDAKN